MPSLRRNHHSRTSLSKYGTRGGGISRAGTIRKVPTPFSDSQKGVLRQVLDKHQLLRIPLFFRKKNKRDAPEGPTASVTTRPAGGLFLERDGSNTFQIRRRRLDLLAAQRRPLFFTGMMKSLLLPPPA